jgi:hypothetical protein
MDLAFNPLFAFSLMLAKLNSYSSHNKYRFRYWAVIGFLNLFHIGLAILKQYVQIPELSEARWLSFMIIDIMLLEIFIVSLKQRKTELMLRVIFYLMLIVDMASGHWILPICEGIILMYVASKSPYPNTNKYFIGTFFLFICMELAPYIQLPVLEQWEGFTNRFSLLVGAIYSINLAYGVKVFYDSEQVVEKMKLEAMDKLKFEGHTGGDIFEHGK